MFIEFSLLSMCYISDCASDCTTYGKDTTNYDSSFLMYSDKIDRFRSAFFGRISNRRNMFEVEAIYMPEKANGQAYYFAALRKLLDDGVLSESDMVAYLSSGKQGTQTSFLEINVVGDVLKYAMDYVLPNRNRYL